MTANIRPITDDRPQMEYAFGGAYEAPAAFFTRTEELPVFCPKCFIGDHADPRVATLPSYMDALRVVYADARFRRNAALMLEPSPSFAEAIRQSKYLAGAFGPMRAAGDNPKPPEGAARALFVAAFTQAQSGALEKAAQDYEKGLALDPSDVDARYNLAVVYASSGREDDAVAQAEKVLTLEPSQLKAKRMLCALRHTHCP